MAGEAQDEEEVEEVVDEAVDEHVDNKDGADASGAWHTQHWRSMTRTGGPGAMARLVPGSLLASHPPPTETSVASHFSRHRGFRTDIARHPRRRL
jgi:hypothetical protein